MNSRRTALAAGIGFLAGVTDIAAPVLAQTAWPTRPVKIVVPIRQAA